MKGWGVESWGKTCRGGKGRKGLMPELTSSFVAVAERSVCLGENRRGNGEGKEGKERRERTREEREEGGGGERGQLGGSRPVCHRGACGSSSAL